VRASVENAKKHIAFNPDDVRALYLGAGGLIELGEMEVAQEWVAKAVELDPEDALVLYNVACVYTQLGEYDKALDCLEQSDTAASSSEALNWIENDPDLDPLRDLPRFQALLGEKDTDKEA
jgi:adenylate cyclase